MKTLKLATISAALLGVAIVETDATSTRVEIRPASGFTLQWHFDNGRYFNTPVPLNAALASQGAVAISSSDLGIAGHVAARVNDGIYGNANSWISGGGINNSVDPSPFVIIRFPASVPVSRIAWGRDNGNTAEGTFTDRALGVYNIEITRVANPGLSTPVTGNASTGWRSVGSIIYYHGTEGEPFSSYLRHEFSIAEGGQPAVATAVRLRMPDGATCVDEIEINPPVVEATLAITPAAGFEFTWNGNNGEHYNPAPAPATTVPSNAALASKGAVAIGSSELAFGGFLHLIQDVNDGLYGNANAWISSAALGSAPAPNHWIGVRLPALTEVDKIAWGRDNGDDSEGAFKDRYVGLYTVQFTRAANPSASTPETGIADTGWQTIGSVYLNAGSDTEEFAPYLRHEFAVRSQGQKIFATGVRIKVSDGVMAIDELEVISNNPPVANAGANQTVQTTANCLAQVTLNGAASTDPDGDSLTYTWRYNGNVIPSSEASATVELTAGAHQFSLTVDDGNGGSNSSSTMVTVLATPTLGTLAPGDIDSNSAGFTMNLAGSCFEAGAVVIWDDGETVRQFATAFGNSGQLSAQIPSDALLSNEEIRLVAVSVRNANGLQTSAQPFAIIEPSIEMVETVEVAPGETQTVVQQAQNGHPTAVAVEAELTNTGTAPITVATAIFAQTPQRVAGARVPNSLKHNSAIYDVKVESSEPLAPDTTMDVTLSYQTPAHGGATTRLNYVSPTGTVRRVNTPTPPVQQPGAIAFTLSQASHPSLSELSGTIFIVGESVPELTVTASSAPVHLGNAVSLDLSYLAVEPEAATIVIDWGDGSSTTIAANEEGIGSASHTYLAADVYTATATVTDVHGDSVTAQTEFVTQNAAPVVTVTTVQNSCDDVDSVTLHGTISDPDGDDLSFEWAQIAGPTVELHNANTLNPHFTPPTVSASATLTFELIANEVRAIENIETLSRSISVNVLVKHANRAPLADAGIAQTVLEGATITLDGSGSFDPDNDSIGAYSWAQTGGPSVQLTGANTANPKFTAPDVGPAGETLTFALIVSDIPNDDYCGAELVSDAQTVSINVQYINHLPTITAPATVAANEGAPVTLPTTASDPDNNPLSRAWSQLSGPAVTLNLLDPANPTFIAPLVACAGTSLSFKALVSDAFGGSAEAVITVNVANLNASPVADAGANRTVPEGAVVTLEATASLDPDGETITFVWSQTGGPAVALDNAQSATPTFTAPIVTAGGDPNASETLQFVLTAFDECGGSATDVVEVKVTNIDHAPVASAGGSQTRCEADFVTLSATASSDPDGDALNYQWTQISGPTVTLSGANEAVASFRAPFTGASGDTLLFEVTVTDGFGGVSKDTATIAIINCNTPPAISQARASETILWPPNHSLIPISIIGIQDPDNNAVITITNVTQDEPINGAGDGDTGPDAVLRGDVALIRAERAGNRTGRVYHIHFTASDPEGSSSGVVTVKVPRSKKTEAVLDEGQLHQSWQ